MGEMNTGLEYKMEQLPLLAQAGKIKIFFHLAWISHKDNASFLNYACLDKEAKPEYHFQTEVHSNVLPVAVLSQQDTQISLQWSDMNGLYALTSTDQGINWRWGKTRRAPLDFYPLRLRSFPGNSSIQEEKPHSSLVLVTGFPPQSRPDNNTNTPASCETDSSPDYIPTLEALVSFLLQRTASLQRNNAALQESIVQNQAERENLKLQHQKQLNRLKEECSSCREDYAGLKEMLNDTKRKLKVKEEAFFLEKKKLKAENKKLQEQCSYLQLEHEKNLAEKSKLKTELSRLQNQMKEVRKKTEELQSQSIWQKLFFSKK